LFPLPFLFGRKFLIILFLVGPIHFIVIEVQFFFNLPVLFRYSGRQLFALFYVNWGFVKYVPSILVRNYYLFCIVTFQTVHELQNISTLQTVYHQSFILHFRRVSFIESHLVLEFSNYSCIFSQNCILSYILFCEQAVSTIFIYKFSNYEIIHIHYNFLYVCISFVFILIMCNVVLIFPITIEIMRI
jgi:hypothetical protein